MTQHPPSASDDFFHSGEQTAQYRWGTRTLWDRPRRERLLYREIPATFIPRLARAPFFFLASSNAGGECDCSFKGGNPYAIAVIDARRFVFPDFEGNGAFMSLGNILQNPRVGCLFIDFNDGARLRINGRASIHETGDLMACFPGAARVVAVDVEQVVPNCDRYIPRLLPVGAEA